VNADSSKALDVCHGGTEDRTKVDVWDIDETDAQNWMLQLLDE